MGHSLTVAGIVNTTFLGVIENTEIEGGYGAVTLTMNNATDCSYMGYLPTAAAAHRRP